MNQQLKDLLSEEQNLRKLKKDFDFIRKQDLHERIIKKAEKDYISCKYLLKEVEKRIMEASKFNLEEFIDLNFSEYNSNSEIQLNETLDKYKLSFETNSRLEKGVYHCIVSCERGNKYNMIYSQGEKILYIENRK